MPSSRRLSGLEPEFDMSLFSGSRAAARALRRIQSENSDPLEKQPKEDCASKRSAKKRKSSGNENLKPSPDSKKPKSVSAKSKQSTCVFKKSTAPKAVPVKSKQSPTVSKKPAAPKVVKPKAVPVKSKQSPTVSKKNAKRKASSPAANATATNLNLKPGDLKRGRLLGKGRFAEVFLVTTSGGDQYAMKVMSVGGKAQLQRYEQELLLHSLAAQHGIAPNIVGSFISPTTGKKKGNIVMEMVDGPTFKELAEDPEKHKSKAVAALQKIRKLHTLGVQSTDGIVERLLACQKQSDTGLHQSGILHCDLNKLDNILWDSEREEPFLIDFGLSQWMEAKVKSDMEKHTRMLKDADVRKKFGFWQSFDCGHIRAKFNLP